MDRVDARVGDRTLEQETRSLALSLIKAHNRIVNELRGRGEGVYERFLASLESWNERYPGRKADDVRRKGEALKAIVLVEFELGSIVQGGEARPARPDDLVRTRGADRIPSGVRTRGAVPARGAQRTEESSVAELLAAVGTTFSGAS